MEFSLSLSLSLSVFILERTLQWITMSRLELFDDIASGPVLDSAFIGVVRVGVGFPFGNFVFFNF